MVDYETTYIIKADLEEDTIASLIEKVFKYVNDNGGEVVNTDRIGKRRLAYELKGCRDGYYVNMSFKSGPKMVNGLNHLFRVTDEIIRGLVVRKQ